MIEIHKQRLFSSTYTVSENGIAVAELRRSCWRTRAQSTLQGRTFQMKTRGAFRRTFVLLEGENPVVEVSQPSGLRSRLVFDYQGRNFEIVNKRWYRSSLVVRSAGVELGTIYMKGFLASRLMVDLASELPLHIRIFLGWIAQVRRDEAAVTAGASNAT